MNKRRFWMAVTVCALWGAWAWAQGLVVCKSCGREAKPGATACEHCKAALPKPKAAETEAKPEVAVPDNAAEIGRGAAAEVEASVKQARELEKLQPEVALSYYQNALALMRLVPAGTYPANVGEAILEGNRRTMQALQRGRVPCKKCGGTGKYQLDMGKVDRKKGVKSLEGVACSACKGQGGVMGYRDATKVMAAVQQGRNEFERRQMVAGGVKVGRAFVPAEVEKRLNNRQRALVMTGVPVPCPECHLAARQTCTACRASGWVKCDQENCAQGLLKETRKAGTRLEKRLNEESVKKCPKCEGLGEIRCPTCSGSGGVACKKCDGSGLAPRCARCTGTGLMACAKCKGTGQVKGGPCPECKGETMVLCTTCRGEGAQSR